MSEWTAGRSLGREPLLTSLFRDTANGNGVDRLAGMSDNLAHMREQLARLELLTRRLEGALHDAPAPVAETGYLLFLSGEGGYRTVSERGACPAVGEELEADGRRYVVLKLGPSPFPNDPRRCAYAERSGPPEQLALGIGAVP